MTELIADGLLIGDVAKISESQVEGRDELERDALGYLAGNCAHCHQESRQDSLGVELDLRAGQGTKALISAESSRLSAKDAKLLIKPGDPHGSVVYRLFTRNMHDDPDSPRGKMPPLGNQVIDGHGQDILVRWIKSLSEQGARGPQTH